jgi:hypothetical protein
MSREVFEAVGVDPETAQKFYDSGGKLETLSASERDKFLASMTDIGAVLAIPSNATRKEWTAAKSTYTGMQDVLKERFGDDILDKIELYYNEKDVDKARAFMREHPEVQAAMDAQTNMIVGTPLLMEYYGGVDTLERYYKSKMYDELEKRFGTDILDLESQYFRIYDQKERTAFGKEHPQLKEYWEAKTKWRGDILKKMVEFGGKLPNKPELELQDVEAENPDQRRLMELQQKAMSMNEWYQALSPELTDLILESFATDKPLSRYAQSDLEYKARQLGYRDYRDMIRDFLISVNMVE